MCYLSEITTYSSLVTKCELEGERILCDQKHKIGTKAYVHCKEGYDTQYIQTVQSTLYTCASNGKWNQPAYQCSAICGFQTARGEQLIVRGTKTEATEVCSILAWFSKFYLLKVPWNVAVYRNKPYPSSKKEFICGGTIISEKIVISAAHCYCRCSFPHNTDDKY